MGKFFCWETRRRGESAISPIAIKLLERTGRKQDVLRRNKKRKHLEYLQVLSTMSGLVQVFNKCLLVGGGVGGNREEEGNKKRRERWREEGRIKEEKEGRKKEMVRCCQGRALGNSATLSTAYTFHLPLPLPWFREKTEAQEGTQRIKEANSVSECLKQPLPKGFTSHWLGYRVLLLNRIWLVLHCLPGMLFPQVTLRSGLLRTLALSRLLTSRLHRFSQLYSFYRANYSPQIIFLIYVFTCSLSAFSQQDVGAKRTKILFEDFITVYLPADNRMFSMNILNKSILNLRDADTQQ